MDLISLLNTEEKLTAFLFGLSIKCPVNGNPECCVLHEIRKLNFSGKQKEIYSMSFTEKKLLLLKHMSCKINLKSYN